MRTCRSAGSSSVDRLDLRELLGVLADDRDRLGVREEVADVLRRARRVDRDPDRADPGEREVDERPLEAVAREQRDVVALPHAAREQPVRVRADALVGLRPRDLAPAVVRLGEVCGRRAARRDGVAPELRDRAPGCAGDGRFEGGVDRLGHVLQLSREGFADSRRIQLVRAGMSSRAPSNTLSPCVRPGTDHSASASSRFPSGSLPRRSPPRGSPTSRSGSCTASARRRSSRSAGARPTTARSRRTRSSAASRSRRASS